MGMNSTDDCPEVLLGSIAVLTYLPGVALLADEAGRVIFGNKGFQSEHEGEADAEDMVSNYRLPAALLSDALGTDQPSYQSLTLPGGRRVGVSCVQLRLPTTRDRYLMIREDSRQAIVAKFASAQEGLLKSRIERDRALASAQKMRAEANHWRLLSMSDRLTGLFNATGFRDRARAALEDSEAGVLIYADLNGFKMINDTLGHAAGDKLLADIGQALSSVFRGGDVVGRLGGDEFAVLLSDCPADEMSNVIERLRKVMTRRIPINFGPERGSKTLWISPAIGAAVYPQEDSDLDKLLQLADARMYADKSKIQEVQAGA